MPVATNFLTHFCRVNAMSCRVIDSCCANTIRKRMVTSVSCAGKKACGVKVCACMGGAGTTA